jgi:hypothetical protein
MRVGPYGKLGQVRTGIHEALAQDITALGWRLRLGKKTCKANLRLG